MYLLYVKHKKVSESNEFGGAETEDEESVLITEDVDPDSEPDSPLKIVTALEEKITPHSSRKGNHTP